VNRCGSEAAHTNCRFAGNSYPVCEDSSLMFHECPYRDLFGKLLKGEPLEQNSPKAPLPGRAIGP